MRTSINDVGMPYWNFNSSWVVSHIPAWSIWRPCLLKDFCKAIVDWEYLLREILNSGRYNISWLPLSCQSLPLPASIWSCRLHNSIHKYDVLSWPNFMYDQKMQPRRIALRLKISMLPKIVLCILFQETPAANDRKHVPITFAELLLWGSMLRPWTWIKLLHQEEGFDEGYQWKCYGVSTVQLWFPLCPVWCLY